MCFLEPLWFILHQAYYLRVTSSRFTPEVSKKSKVLKKYRIFLLKWICQLFQKGNLLRPNIKRDLLPWAVTPRTRIHSVMNISFDGKLDFIILHAINGSQTESGIHTKDDLSCNQGFSYSIPIVAEVYQISGVARGGYAMKIINIGFPTSSNDSMPLLLIWKTVR